MPPHETSTPVVVLPMAARHRFLRSWPGADAPAYLSLRDPALNGWPERRGPIAPLATDLLRGRTRRSPRAVPEPATPLLAPGLHGRGRVLGGGRRRRLVAPRRNRYAQRLPRGADDRRHEVHGVEVPTLPLMAAPTVHECTFPVDVVVTWVDGDDPAWNAARVDAAGRADRYGDDARVERAGPVRLPRRAAPLAAQPAPLRALGTPDPPGHGRPGARLAGPGPPAGHRGRPLRDPPAGRAADVQLPRDRGRAAQGPRPRRALRLPQRRLLPRPAARPGDVLHARPGWPRSGCPPTRSGSARPPDAPPYLKAAWNNRRLLQEAFGAVVTDNLAHAPYPHRRSVLEAIERRFPDEVARTARSPFRSDTDLSMLSSFAQHYGLLTGTSYVGDVAARLRQHQQQRPRVAAQEGPGAGAGLPLPGRPPRPRPQRRSARPDPR